MRRARPRASRVLMVASVLVAAGATFVLRGHLERLEAQAASAGPGQPLVVAAEGLDRGTVLEPAMLTARPVPIRYRPPGALAQPADAVGRALATDVVAGEPVTAGRLAPPGGPVASLVPPGLRGAPVTAPIPRGTLSSGDRVDVLATYGAGQPHTETVATAVEVLLVLPGTDLDEFGGGSTVILLVDPETAKRLAYARAFAELALTVASAEPLPGPGPQDLTEGQG
jgi:pilus assembly protein CpaB